MPSPQPCQQHRPIYSATNLAQLTRQIFLMRLNFLRLSKQKLFFGVTGLMWSSALLAASPNTTIGQPIQPMILSSAMSDLILGNLAANQGRAVETAMYFEQLTRVHPRGDFLLQCFNGALQSGNRATAEKCYSRLEIFSREHLAQIKTEQMAKKNQNNAERVGDLPQPSQTPENTLQATPPQGNIFTNQSERLDTPERQQETQLIILKARMVALTYPEMTAPTLFIQIIANLTLNQQRAMIAEIARITSDLKLFQRGERLFAEITKRYPDATFKVFHADFQRHLWWDKKALSTAQAAFNQESSPLTLLEYVEALQQNGEINLALSTLAEYQKYPAYINPVLRTRMEKTRNLRPEADFRTLLDEVSTSGLISELDAPTLSYYLSHLFELKDYPTLLALLDKYEQQILSSGNNEAMMMFFYLRGATLLEMEQDSGQSYIERINAVPRFARLEQQRRLRHQIKVDGLESTVQSLFAQKNIIRAPMDYLITSRVLLENHREHDALAFLQSGLAFHPKDPSILYEAAMVAIKLENLPLMEEYLKRAIEINPKDYHARNALGYSWVDKGINLQKAKAEILVALGQQPLEPVILDSLGWYYYRVGNQAEALSFLKRAYYLQHDAEIAAHIIEVLGVSKHAPHRAEAQSFYQNAQTLIQSKSDIKTRVKEEKVLRTIAAKVGLRLE